MNYQDQTAKLILADKYRMDCLRAARELNLPDWYLGAGFLRNAIWDHLHGKEQMTPLNDIDFVYFDTKHVCLKTEQQIEAQLQQCFPVVSWEVRNQARMHVKHGHQPYSDTVAAISQWIEVPTCVGVRLEPDDKLVFCAPFGLGENWSLKVRINPNNSRPEIFRQRIAEKNWLKLWSKLQING
ncbi:nucleotidyltransferase family protein [uncultured Photobacterium sp.]|uniref:nucleotidyltransferase family protein n=1 Tax=uncultured Photobacterium sp. TaxID=173973 RepID=UPI00260AF9A8|nr:nucleotidyltransferase family protein [uncultured Photobacterium sp.]